MRNVLTVTYTNSCDPATFARGGSIGWVALVSVPLQDTSSFSLAVKPCPAAARSVADRGYFRRTAFS